MDRKSGMLLASLVLSVLMTAGMAVMRTSQDTAPQGTRQLTQEQRLDTLDKLSPDSPVVHNMVAGERENQKALSDAQGEGR